MNPTPSPSPQAPPQLEIRGLGKRFPGVIALDDVSLDLRAGEVHGLVGQNGAGKSTLINILSGMLSADTGTIRIGGAPVAIRDPRHAIALGIATVYQELSLLPNLTVAQNLALGREPGRFGLLDRKAAAATATRHARPPRPRHPAGDAGQQPVARRAADDRDRQGAFVEPEDPRSSTSRPRRSASASRRSSSRPSPA